MIFFILVMNFIQGPSRNFCKSIEEKWAALIIIQDLHFFHLKEKCTSYFYVSWLEIIHFKTLWSLICISRLNSIKPHHLIAIIKTWFSLSSENAPCFKRIFPLWDFCWLSSLNSQQGQWNDSFFNAHSYQLAWSILLYLLRKFIFLIRIPFSSRQKCSTPFSLGIQDVKVNFLEDQPKFSIGISV